MRTKESGLLAHVKFQELPVGLKHRHTDASSRTAAVKSHGWVYTALKMEIAKPLRLRSR
jgi:hypothetical protein